ncbi:MAG: DNA repair exonuclease [Candidatus Aenigmarchaeota archaeon]|nr:DNA repair exonuclease [Candidatus Aenigmarchaeota archaeon]
MYKFAHIADCHLGAFRDQTLRKLNLDAFKLAMDKCIEENVDFIIIAGDLFDIHLPDTKILDEAVRKMREVKQKGINIYVLYGSHDYSPTQTSMIDVLASAGLFEKIGTKFITDEKTRAKIVGIKARTMGLERKEYETLDLKKFENEKGFKIFVFHSAVTEIHPQFTQVSVPLANFPKGFDYYAGGHIHEKAVEKFDSYGLFALPGTLFGASYKDLEYVAMGNDPGFFIIEFNESGIKSHRFISTKICDVEYVEYDATGKTSSQAEEEIKDLINGIDPSEKIILFKVKGELSAGNPSDIPFSGIKSMILEKGAKVVYLNRNKLKTKEKEEVKVEGETKEEIEKKLFENVLNELKLNHEELIGEKGVELAIRLLNILKEEKRGETKSDYERKILTRALHEMGLL